MIPLLPGLALGAVLAVSGVSLVYLASPNQRPLRRPLGRGALVGGLLLVAGALAALLLVMGTLAAVATWAVAVMLAATAIPFLGLFRGRRP